MVRYHIWRYDATTINRPWIVTIHGHEPDPYSFDFENFSDAVGYINGTVEAY